MASTFTVEKESVFGDLRVRIGTLVMTDGDAASPIASGLNYVYHMAMSSSQNARATLNGTTNGNVSVCTAASGASYKVMILGQ